MDRYRLTPMALSDNPALGLLVVVLEGLRLARLALAAAHGSLCQEEFRRQSSEEARAEAYAFSILTQMQALEDTINSYLLSTERVRRRPDDDDDPVNHESLF